MKTDRREFLKAGLAAGSGLALAGVGSRLAASETVLSPEDKAKLLEQARAIFTANRTQMFGRTFHFPSAGNYHSFFAWDSGTNVIGGKYLFPEDSRAELEAVYSFMQPSGRVPHEVRDPAYKEKEPARAAVIALVKSQYDAQGVSALIDPPNYFHALWDLYRFTGDQRVRALAPKAEQAAEYLRTSRDLFGDGLVSIIHPWESGTDSSPVFDETIGVNFKIKNPAMSVAYLTRYVSLLNRLAKINFDPQKVAQQNIFVFEDVGFNSWTALGLQGLAQLFESTGDKVRAEKYRSRAQAIVDAMEKIFWDEKDGFFYPRWNLKSPRLSRRKTVSGILPLMTGLVNEDKARRVIEHLKNPAEFWTPYPVSFNSDEELKKDKLSFENLMLWRGHCIWTNMNWGISLALEKYGEQKAARELAVRTGRMILESGFREFYDPRTGQGLGAKNFTWPALVLDMIAQLKI